MMILISIKFIFPMYKIFGAVESSKVHILFWMKILVKIDRIWTKLSSIIALNDVL